MRDGGHLMAFTRPNGANFMQHDFFYTSRYICVASQLFILLLSMVRSKWKLGETNNKEGEIT